MAKVEVLNEYCKSCGLCIDICPKKILVIGDKANKKGYFTVKCEDQEKCIGCALCATVCPDVAIEVYK
ncbi:indolepyruvate ferredoxin oxidoreductase subunit alpha [Alkaliphilus peptidifermentans]|uniref:2-oxoglutarate ferredoxin oxidoreductase subunit delta n=1 Tax=Alkaliphilus peptidifermentans DSM 18978 TaxID=1120976 RepID=A0A1G5K6Y9_9FIRM|nr:4Fe-4S dicluster domain-containing protein [Alkaliphilus peptidifermentans]SCY96373.1 2-oxoglutarate ferredoxin oxidoreductase subunit delta [Alkaliphilus peptidifermentans DSM 18978]